MTLVFFGPNSVTNETLISIYLRGNMITIEVDSVVTVAIIDDRGEGQFTARSNTHALCIHC